MNSGPNPFQTDLVLLRKLHQERNQTCLAFLIQGFFSSIFLFILDKSLVVIQLPVIMVFLAFYIRPSFSKKLLPQQYMGLVALGLCVIKSLYLIINMIIYLSYFFSSSGAMDPESTGTNTVFVRFEQNDYLFPDIAPRTESGVASFLAGVVIVIFVLMTLFEILSLYVTVFIFRRTKKIVEKVKTLRLPDASDVQSDLNVQNAEEEHEREGFVPRRIDRSPTAVE